MPHTVRSRIVAARIVIGTSLATATAVLGVSVVGADPPPTLEEVRADVDDLHAQAAEANERHNIATEQLTNVRRELERAQSRVDRQNEHLEQVTEQVGAFAAASYRSAGVDPSISALLSEDIGQYLADASALDAFANQQSALLDEVASERISLEQARLMAAEHERRLETIETALRVEQSSIAELLGEQQRVLDRLTADQQAELRRQEQRSRAASFADRSEASFRLAGVDSSDAPASERAAGAVQVALTKVGSGYSYGSAGPNVFDCSGFTGWAYASAGVSLPRSSSAQFSVGTAVSTSELAPGDLLFYGSPISHVAMYIGDGTVVHASNPRTGVTTAPMMQAGGPNKPFVGAKRP